MPASPRISSRLSKILKMTTTDLISSGPADDVQAALKRAISSEEISSSLYEDEFPPTEMAKTACVTYLGYAAARFSSRESFPMPHVEAGGNGDLRCEWNWGDRRMAITFSHQGIGRVHTFDSTQGQPALASHFDPTDLDRLVEALRWVAGYAQARG
jgi:hypothetical protein